MLQRQTDEHWLLLSGLDTITPAHCIQLLEYFKNADTFLQAGKQSLTKAGLSQRQAEHLIERKKTFDIKSLKNNLERSAISYITWEDAEYPSLLKQIYNPPKVLYYQGRLPQEKQIFLAVVGSRKMSSYGKAAITKLLPPLIQSGIGIVSGLAFGIDREAHESCLDNEGITLAVMGSGLDPQSFYPSENRHLAKKIISEGGAVLSEYPPGTPPLKYHFPLRNRIIAGLAHGTMVIEANSNSGSLITANSALEENREVFAVPGNINAPLSYGTNELIKKGAQLVKDAGDIIEVFGLRENARDSITRQYMKEPILQILNDEPQHIDVIAKRLHLTVSEVSVRLSQLEIKGMIKNTGGMHYTLIKYA